MKYLVIGFIAALTVIAAGVFVPSQGMMLVYNQEGPQQDKLVDKGVKDDYDPDKLGPGEVACGRPHSKKSAPCQCMKHRIAEAEKEADKCFIIENKKERQQCAFQANPCAVKVVDSEYHYNPFDDGPKMPPQCKRTCHKARCECCKT